MMEARFDRFEHPIGATRMAHSVDELWFRLDRLDLPHGLIVVDVSRAASNLWPVFRSLLEGIAETLPPSSWPNVAFLGASEHRPLRQFLDGIDALHAANRGRGRVVGPLFHALANQPPTQVVLIGAGAIVDLEDWFDTEQIQRTRFVKLTPQTTLTQGHYPESIADLDEIARWVDLAVQSVRVAADGAVIFDWDEPSYVWENGAIRSPSFTGSCPRVGFLSPMPIRPEVELQCRDGSIIRQLMQPADRPAELPWRTFTASEFTIISQWVRQGNYECPCGQAHPAGEWACAATGTPRPLLTSFSTLPSGRLVRLRLGAFQARYQPLRATVTRLGEQQIAVADDQGRLQAYRYDPAQARWQPTGEPRAFLMVEEGIHAVVV